MEYKRKEEPAPSELVITSCALGQLNKRRRSTPQLASSGDSEDVRVGSRLPWETNTLVKAGLYCKITIE